jgi:hypothetical protein
MGVNGNRRGLNSILTVMFIILGTFIGVALLWAFILKSANRSNEVVDPDCLTIDLEILDCKAYGACSYYGGLGYYEADVLIKRDIGRGNITGLRFIFENPLKRKGTYDIDLSTKDLSELQSIKFTEPDSSIPVQGLLPDLLSVTALIGKNKDVCPVTSNSIKCPALTTPPPQGNVSNNTYAGGPGYANSNRAGNCCQWPVNYSECYNGGDSEYTFDPTTKRLIVSSGLPPLPAGNKTVCCQLNPYNGGMP